MVTELLTLFHQFLRGVRKLFDECANHAFIPLWSINLRHWNIEKDIIASVTSPHHMLKDCGVNLSIVFQQHLSKIRLDGINQRLNHATHHAD